MSWGNRPSSRGVKDRDYVTFSGIAYPSVLEGANATDEVVASVGDREAFYRDPAVVLSDADLDKFGGTEGAPICVEHDSGAGPVGSVRHSWISTERGRGLHIVGRVSTKTERGREVAKKLLNGHFKGLSVGYGMGLTNNSRGTANLTSKIFREISLCKEPFFDRCRISVAASKEKATKDPTYKSRGQNPGSVSTTPENSGGKFYIPIVNVMASNGENAPTDAPASGGEQHQQQQQQGDAVPRADAQELLKQADLLKEANAEKDRRLKEMEAALKANQAENAKFREADAERAAKYAEQHMPEYEEYVKTLEDIEGQPMDESLKESYKQTFTNPAFEKGRKSMWAMHQRGVEVAASKKAAEESLAAALDKNKKLNSAVGKATNAIVSAHKREEIVTTLSPEQAENAMDYDASKRKEVDVTASRGVLEPGQIMMAAPHAKEFAFLQQYGFGPQQTTVTASGEAVGYAPVQRRAPMKLYEPPVHNRFFDSETGECNFPNSARNYESGKRHFAFMCDSRLDLANRDLSTMVSLVAARNETVRKDAGQFESKRRNGGAQ